MLKGLPLINILKYSQQLSDYHNLLDLITKETKIEEF